MNKLFVSLSLPALLIAAPAIAGDQDFTLYNKTGYDIAEVYVSPARANAWGKDVLKDNVLEDTHYIPITFKATNSTCTYDLKVVFTDGDDAHWSNFDLCTISKISIFWNAKTQKATAKWE
ncbi:MAG: argininosuccinate lyase [Sphingobium sp.]